MSGFSLHELFRADAEAQLAVLNDGLLALERDPGAAAGIEPLMRAAHSIKGAARIVNLELAVIVAHAMEDALVAVQAGREAITAGRVDQLLRGTDFLARAAEQDEASLAAWSEEHRATAEVIAAALRAPAPTSPTSTEAETVAAAPANTAAAEIARVDRPLAPDAGTRVAEDQAPLSSGHPEGAGAGATPGAAATPSDGGPAVAKTTSPAQPPSANGETARSSAAPVATTRGEPVRVSAERLERIMQLSGEILVAGRRFESLRQTAQGIRDALTNASDGLRALFNASAAQGEVSPAEQTVAAPLLHELAGARTAALRHIEGLEELSRRIEELSSALSHAALGSRMRPFGDLSAAFPRMVRDLARQLNRRVRLDIVGTGVHVDREMLSRLEAPLTHLLRNCIDHGIEPPAERVTAGKPEEATITLSARHHAGRLVISVADDGRGIDAARVRARAIERGLVPESIARDLDESEVLEFLFLPGFSTASEVTEISGRGVGLDVVQSMAHEVGGAVQVRSKPGAGTTFTMTLPVAVSVVRATIVEVAGEPLAFPLARLERIVRRPSDELTTVQGRLQFDQDGASIGVVDAATVLELGERAVPDEVFTAVVVGGGRQRYGLLVDRLVGEEDLVVRTLDPRLGKVPHVSAAALLEGGDPVLIVDTEDLVASIRQLLGEGRTLGSSRPAPGRVATPGRVLVVDDSATVREVERQLLTRAGYLVDTAIDGVDGWNALVAGRYELVVTDVDMPRMNGIELVRRIRADARFASLPLVIVSYKDREEDRLRGMEAGANAYLTKGSFQDETFINLVRDLIGAPTA